MSTARIPDGTPLGLVLICDRRCSRCQESGRTSIYRMVGGCYNCKSEPILGLFSVTHQAHGGDCPVCKCDRLHWDRLATPDEIPEMESWPRTALAAPEGQL